MALLATLMSKAGVEMLKNEGSYTKLFSEHQGIRDLEKRLGYIPTFCIQIDEDSLKETLFKFLFTSCNIPQRLVIFRSDNIKYLEFTGWMNLIGNEHKDNLVISNKDTENYTEVLIESIDYDSVVEIVDISDTNDVDAVQDEYLNFLYDGRLTKVLEKYSKGKAHISDIKDADDDVKRKYFRYVYDLNYGICKVKEEMIRNFKEFIYQEVIM